MKSDSDTKLTAHRDLCELFRPEFHLSGSDWFVGFYGAGQENLH